MKENLHIATLIDKYIRKELDDKEQQELNDWLQDNENKALFDRMINKEHQLNKLMQYQSFNKSENWKQLESKINNTKYFNLFNRRTFLYAASILLPIIMIGSIVLYFYSKQPDSVNIAKVDEIIQPGTQKATLILSNGNEINLSEEISTIKDEGFNITNNSKTLHYNNDNKAAANNNILFNELRTPFGGTYNIKLADGTEVWLNAGSVLRFPVEFTDSVRKVHLTGEGYFDVSHNGKPFIVSMENADVRVLGTSFNISAYNNDEAITTTLIEGKVLLEINDEDRNFKNHILTPGDQAVLSKDEHLIDINQVNTSSYVSWKNGKLEFNSESLEQVMKKLSRWYNFSYRFDNAQAKDYHFTARFSNIENVSTILEMLELTTSVKFTYENNTIVIL